jgi:hypothetical protein
MMLQEWLSGPYLVVAILVALFMVYHLVQWIRASRNYRDSADDHTMGCLRVLDWGCLGCSLPVAVIVLLIILII